MSSTPLLPLLSAPLWLGIVAPDRVLAMVEIELLVYLKCEQINDLCETEFLEIELFDHLSVCKRTTDV